MAEILINEWLKFSLRNTLDAKQQKQIIQDLKSSEVSEEVLHKVAGGIREHLENPITTQALGEEAHMVKLSKSYT